MNMTYKAGWVALVSAIAASGTQAQEGGGFALGDVEVAEEKPFYTSEVEFGLGYNTEDSFKFGQYNGLEDDGLFIIGNIDVLRRGAYDGEDTRYWSVRGNNLGLDSRDLEAEYGKQGSYKASIFYDQVPHNRIGDGETIYNGAGGDNLTLPAGVPTLGTLDPNATQLDPYFRKLEIEHERKRFGAALKYELNNRWSVDLKAQREERDGTKLTSGVFGSSGGNPRAVLLPEPIDYTTDRVDLGLNYTGKQGQMRIAYSGSFFDNDNDALRWDNFWNNGQWGGAAQGGDAQPDAGQLGLPPENEAHYLSLSGAYNVSPKTRLHGQARYSILQQDDDFLPYTINSNPPMINPALPRNSLDGELRELLVDLAADSRITDKLSVRGSLRYRDSENRTPRNTYTVVHADVVNPALDGGDDRINLPYEFTQTKLGIEGTYRLGMMTKLKGGYRFEQIERNLQEVDETDEHSVFVGLSGMIGDSVQGQVEYTRSERDGDSYDTGKPFREGHTLDYVLNEHNEGCEDIDGRCENHPGIRKYHESDRDRDDITGSLNWFNESGFSVGLQGTYRQDDFDAELGLSEQKTTRFTIEPSYQMGDELTTYAYLTWEQLEYDQKGHDFRAGADSFTEPTQRWSLDTEDQITTIGLGLTRKNIFRNTDLVVEYTYSDAKTEMSAKNAGNTTVFPDPATDLPDLESTLHRFSLGLDYAHKDNLTYRFRYIYEDYETDDFAVDGTDRVAGNNVLGIGNSSPDYSAHVFGVSMLYKFE